VRISVDAQALIAREQAATEAVSQAMLAVTSLRHLTPDKERGPSRRSCLLTGYSGHGDTPCRALACDGTRQGARRTIFATAHRAVMILVDAGYVRISRGKGTFVNPPGERRG
jgi:hypothetical protein